MKFILGIIVGTVLGGYLFDNMTSEQRSKVSGTATKAAGKVKNSKIAETVVDNAAQVGDAASERVADAVDAAGDKATEVVAKNETV